MPSGKAIPYWKGARWEAKAEAKAFGFHGTEYYEETDNN
jgi:hypothetical protein